MSGKTRFHLEAFGLSDHLSHGVCGVNGELMVFDTLEDARDMGVWMMEGTEQGASALDGDEPILPFLQIIGFTGPEDDPTGDEYEGWDEGYFRPDGVIRPNTEQDEALWDEMNRLFPVEGDKPSTFSEEAAAVFGPRTVLVHLNVEVPADDPRNADEVGDFILAALEVGLEGAPGSLASGSEFTVNRLTVCAPLIEEV